MGFLKSFTVKRIILLAACCGALCLHAQELFPYTEPASNMPSHSLSAKLSSMFEKENGSQKIAQRYSPEVMLGLSKKWMVHAGFTLSDMMQEGFGGESVRLYAKYRFLSNDAVHRHFRMAAFLLASYSRNPLRYNEINLYGDQSGVQGGVIATQLLHKLALSGTVSLAEILHGERWKKRPQNTVAWQAIHYSFSAGFLLFPLNYTNYNQTNVNLYVEVLGSHNLAWPFEKDFVDAAPSVQAIFNSTGKLNIGYRFQLAGAVSRFANAGFMISYEHLFLNALRKKRSLTN